MNKPTKATIEVRGTAVTVLSQTDQDYISLTDIARFKDSDRTDYIIQNWLRNRNTIEFLGIWEQLNNPYFNPIEFDGIRKQAGLNSFVLTAKRWQYRRHERRVHPHGPGAAMTSRLILASVTCGCALAFSGWACASAAPAPADLVIRNANVITVDTHFTQAEAVAVAGDKILIVGNNQEISHLIGPNTRVIDAKGKTVLPGLCDSHVHSYRASVSEFGAPMPVLNSLAEAFDYLRQQAARQAPGSWIILER